ncbi:MAG: histidine--tRNA ligase [Nocardioidaceae bacterium]
MAKTTPLSGFPEFLPSQRAAELAVIDSVRETFELHGFASIETRSVESLDELMRKGETSHEVYVLRRLHADPDADDAGREPHNVLGLHFDLTVPLARYVVEHQGHLAFPLRRYQIQRCWRGERPQEGRYREFTQADIDIIGRDELHLDADIEVTIVMAEALSRLPLPPITLRVNNRKLIEGFYRGLGVDDPVPVIRAIDKLDKIGADAVRADLLDAGLTADQAGLCLDLAQINRDDASFVDDVRKLGIAHPLLDQGLDELARAVEAAAPANTERFAVVADLKIARGLDYYTGTVFEGFTAAHGSLSICAGGRYDSLARDSRSTYPGVGISLGITRLLAPLISRGVLDADRSVPSCVLVAVPDDATRAVSRDVARRLRSRGIPTEVAPSAAKYGRQIRHADRRGIPYVWFPPGADSSGGHQVKDIRSGDQVDADPDAWQPPTADLRPRIVTKERDT